MLLWLFFCKFVAKFEEAETEQSRTERELLELCSLGESTTDRPEGNQFVARIWRTTQKDEVTTQKAIETLITTTQKEENTTQKSKTTTQKPLNNTQKRILEHLRNYPKATRLEVASALGDITEDGVKFNIGLLQQYGVLKRVNGRKNSEWVVIDQ